MVLEIASETRSPSMNRLEDPLSAGLPPSATRRRASMRLTRLRGQLETAPEYADVVTVLEEYGVRAPSFPAHPFDLVWSASGRTEAKDGLLAFSLSCAFQR